MAILSGKKEQAEIEKHGQKPTEIGHAMPSMPNFALDNPPGHIPPDESILHPLKAVNDILSAIYEVSERLMQLYNQQQKERMPIDQHYLIGSTLAYTVDYKERKYVYVYTFSACTLLTPSSSIPVAATTWTNLSLARGTEVTLQGGSDVNPTTILIRCCDVPLDVSVSVIAGSLTANAGTGWAASGLAKESGGHLASIDTNTTAIAAPMPASLGQKTMAASFPVVLPSNQVAGPAALADGMANPTTLEIGAFLMGWNGSNWGRVLNAQYSATGNSNDNGVVVKGDMLVWNGSSWDFLTKGQTTMVQSLPVTLASDQSPIPTTSAPASSATATITNVSSANVDTPLIAANTSRKGLYFYNDSTAILYLLFGTGVASTTNYTLQIPAQGFYEVPVSPNFIGGFHGIWSAVNGAVRITELS